jgi:3'(2'), 5'-bisphosphate nucleotidase
MEWDTAAGHAIVKGVGKNVYSHVTGKEMVYNKLQLLNDWFIVK